MTASLYWWAHELFDTGSTCKSMLTWYHDPYAIGAVSGNDRNFKSYLKVQAMMIESGGYLQSEARAAVATLLSLVPHFQGTMTPEFQTNSLALFNKAGHYLAEWNETVSHTPDQSFNLRQILASHLHRALLEDALQGEISLAEWRSKVELFAVFYETIGASETEIWDQALFEDIGWPGSFTDESFSRHTILGIKPDLLSLLCLYEKHSYAETLIETGYDLRGFILFSLQPDLMENYLPKSPACVHISRYCELGFLTGKRRRWGLVDANGVDQQNALSWIAFTKEDESADLDIKGLADAALCYLKANPEGIDFKEIRLQNVEPEVSEEG